MENLSEITNTQKGGLQKLWEKLPGVGGYEKLEDRRDTDKLVRESIAQRFEEQWNRLNTIQRELAKGAGILYIGDVDSAALKVRRFIDKIKTAAYGYAGATDAIHVDESVLQQMYDYDLYLFNLSDSVKAAVDKLEDSVYANSGIAENTRELNTVMQECLTALDRRAEVRQGTQNS